MDRTLHEYHDSLETVHFLEESNAIEDVHSIEALDDAIEAWHYLAQENFLNEENVLECHRILMKRQDVEDRYKGTIRDVDVWYGSKKLLPAEYIQELLSAWFDDHRHRKIRIAKTSREKEIIAKELHIDFLKVHPFVDGNGRMARIIMNWLRVKNGIPALVVHKNDGWAFYRECFDDEPSYN